MSYACPWANRCLAALYLKGLEDVIGVSITHPTWQRSRPNDPNDHHTGWFFAAPTDPPVSNSEGQGYFDCEGCVPDTVEGVKFVRDLYEIAEDTNGKYTVPILWDTKERTIVNNESSEILRIFNTGFNDIAKNPKLDLYPADLRSEIDAINEWVYPNINNGVYRCGFATTQGAYDLAFKYVFFITYVYLKFLSRRRYFFNLFIYSSFDISDHLKLCMFF